LAQHSGDEDEAARSTSGDIAYYAVTSKWKWLFANVCEYKRPISTTEEFLGKLEAKMGKI
jgi:hypothetical protein